MSTTNTSRFGYWRERVRSMMVQGEPLSLVEEMLAAVRLAPDEKDALWLFGWSLAQRADRAVRPPPARDEVVSS